MPHGALFQAQQALHGARSLPRWQQNLLVIVLLVAGIALLAFGDLVGLAPLAAVGLFVLTRMRGRTRHPDRPAHETAPVRSPERCRQPLIPRRKLLLRADELSDQQSAHHVRVGDRPAVSVTGEAALSRL